MFKNKYGRWASVFDMTVPPEGYEGRQRSQASCDKCCCRGKRELSVERVLNVIYKNRKFDIEKLSLINVDALERACLVFGDVYVLWFAIRVPEI